MRQADDHEQETFGPRERRICCVLNGPPGCGKDTIATILQEDYFYHHGSFKRKLYMDTADHYNVDLTWFISVATHRDTKDAAFSALAGGLSPRECLIHVSESVIKPNLGTDYYGKCLAKHCETIGGSFVISDGGFSEEITPLTEVFDCVYIVRLWRKGYDFGGDSRKYLYATPELCLPSVSFTDVMLAEDRPRIAAADINLRIISREEWV